jgi:hypothetical protein
MMNQNSPINGDAVQFSVVHTVYKTKTVYREVDGKKIPEIKEVLGKQICVRKWFRKDGITSIEESVTSANTICKKRCIIFDKYSNKFYELFHPAGHVIEQVERTVPKREIGFNHDTTVHARQSSVHQHKKRG